MPKQEELKLIQCESDFDCPPDMVCRNGKCISVKEIICKDDDDCPDGYVCRNGECISQAEAKKREKEEYVPLKVALKERLEEGEARRKEELEKERKKGEEEAIERERINKIIREIFDHLCYLKEEANDMIVAGIEESDTEKVNRALVISRLIENAKNNCLQGVWGNKNLLRLVERGPTKKIKENREKLFEAHLEEQPQIMKEIHEEEKKQGEWRETLTTIQLSPKEIMKALSEKGEKREKKT